MRKEARHQSPVLRNTEISEEFFETLCSIANDPNPRSGVVDWVPKGVPARQSKRGQGATVDKLPAFLAESNLKPFITKELEESTRSVIFKPFRTYGFKGIATATDRIAKAQRQQAELLPLSVV